VPSLKRAFASDFITIRTPSTVRPSLSYSVAHSKTSAYINSAIVNRIKNKSFQNAKGIIYVSRIRDCESVKSFLLQSLGQSTTILLFNGPMGSQEKSDTLEKFSTSSCILVATSAFGTGIDIPNVQFVYHYGMTSSLLDYVQESGRASRDSESLPFPGDCVVFTSPDERDSFIKTRLEHTKSHLRESVKAELLQLQNYLLVSKLFSSYVFLAY
jgi:superfamily II DNA helicase RecQ